jgi:hypothetical protein
MITPPPSREPSRKRTKDVKAVRGAIAAMKRSLVSIVFWWYLALKPRQWSPAAQYRPGWVVGKLEPGAKRAPPEPKSVYIAQELCDACHATVAKFRVLIIADRDLYLCGHHFHHHRLHVAMHGYEVKEL